VILSLLTVGEVILEACPQCQI